MMFETLSPRLLAQESHASPTSPCGFSSLLSAVASCP